MDTKEPQNPLVTMVSAQLSCLDWFLLAGGKEYLLQIQATESDMSFPVGLLTCPIALWGKEWGEISFIFQVPQFYSAWLSRMMLEEKRRKR